MGLNKLRQLLEERVAISQGRLTSLKKAIDQQVLTAVTTSAQMGVRVCKFLDEGGSADALRREAAATRNEPTIKATEAAITQWEAELRKEIT